MDHAPLIMLEGEAKDEMAVGKYNYDNEIGLQCSPL
jgi:hypothetical protein